MRLEFDIQHLQCNLCITFLFHDARLPCLNWLCVLQHECEGGVGE